MDGVSDVFDEDGDLNRVEEVAWEKLQSSRLKEGFVEGKYQGEESTLQEGFNKGYEEGFQYNFPVAEIRGIIGALKSFLKKSDSCWQQIQEIGDELTQLECDVIELQRISLVSRGNETKKNSEKEAIPTSDTDKSYDASCVCVGNKGAVTCNDKEYQIIAKQFHSLKEKSASVLEEYGFSKLSQLIANILFKNVF